MRKHNRLHVGAGLLVVLAAACQPQDVGDEDATETVRGELLGGVTLDVTTNIGQNNGPCTGVFTAAELTTLRSWINSAAQQARATTASPAMAECLENTFEVGGISYSWGVDNRGPFGPYCRAGDSGCPAGGDDGKDPYNDTALASASMTNTRRGQSMRLFNEGQSWFPITLYCDNEPPSTNPPACGGTTLGTTPGNSDKGTFFMDEAKVIIGRANLETILHGAPCNSDGGSYKSYFTSQLMWHEGLHYQGYSHEMDHNAAVWMTQVPGMYQYCLHRIQQVSNQTPAAAPDLPASCTSSPPCAPGFYKLVQNHVHDAVAPTGCVCVRDPASSAPRVDRVLTNTGPLQMVVDSKGRFFRRASNSEVFRRDTSWTSVYPSASFIMAGGDRLFVVSNGNLFRSDKLQNNFTDLGPISCAIAGRCAVDDFGTFYKIVSGTVYRARVAQTAFTALAAVNASYLFAGGDQLFARDTGTGNILRYDPQAGAWTTIGSPGSTFAVDATGAIYGLAPDRSQVMRYSGAKKSWSVVGGAATSIIGGRRIFATNSAREVYELQPDGSWQFVTGSFDDWSSRGPNLAVKVAGTWHSFTDY